MVSTYKFTPAYPLPLCPYRVRLPPSQNKGYRSYALTTNKQRVPDPYTPPRFLAILYCKSDIMKKKRAVLMDGSECLRYLSSRAVTRKVLSAHMSLTSVFGMGTGGPSWQSTQTIQLYHSPQAEISGDPYRIRTDVNGVRGRCLNHLTNGPLVQLQGLEPGTH